MVKYLNTTTGTQMDAQEYCNLHNIGVEIMEHHSGYAVWISYPNGIDRVYDSHLVEEVQAVTDYWKACEFAAGVWWSLQEENKTVAPPLTPTLPSVPQVPQVPQVPKIPMVPQVPQVPDRNLSVPSVPIVQ